MGHETIDRMALLKRLLDIARGQKTLFAENRYADLAGTMAEREDIISRLKGAGEAVGREEGALIKEILGYDGNLRLSLEVELEEISHSLEKLSNCNMAHKAYVSGRLKTPSERSSRDG